jgi:hypothetical protein
LSLPTATIVVILASHRREHVEQSSSSLRPYQVVLQLTDDSTILDFLLANVGWFDMYVEDDYAAYVRYCFEDPLDAEIFRARFEPKVERLSSRDERVTSR